MAFARSMNPAPPNRMARAWRYLNRDRVLAILVLSPSLLAIAIFVYGFIGLDNHRGVLGLEPAGVAGLNRPGRTTDWITGSGYFDLPRWYKDIRNMVIFTILFLTQCMVFGFLIAAFLDQQVKGEGFLPNHLHHALCGFFGGYRRRLELGDAPNPRIQSTSGFDGIEPDPGPFWIGAV